MPWFLPDLKTPKNQAMDFEILNNPSIQFWSTFSQQIGKNTPPYPCISLGIPKKKKGYNYLK